MNRAERRRQERLAARGLEEVPLAEAAANPPIQMVCAWEGCENNCFFAKVLPAGWRNIVLSTKSLFDPTWVNSPDRDGVLCPIHFDELDGMLK